MEQNFTLLSWTLVLHWILKETCQHEYLSEYKNNNLAHHRFHLISYIQPTIRFLSPRIFARFFSLSSLCSIPRSQTRSEALLKPEKYRARCRRRLSMKLYFQDFYVTRARARTHVIHEFALWFTALYLDTVVKRYLAELYFQELRVVVI